MGEDRKDVWSKIRGRVEELRFLHGPRGTLPDITVHLMVEQQQRTLDGIRGAPDFELRQKSSPEAVGERCVRNPDWAPLFKENVLACHAELSEALEWAPWKSWKAYQEPLPDGDIQNCKLELVDALCFLLNCWLLLGGDGNELALMHRAKCEENLARQKGEYR